MTDQTTSIDEQIAYWSHEFKGPLTDLQMLTLGPRDLAIQRALLASLERLKVANTLLPFAICPECDGSGSYPDPADGQQTQCRWCHERSLILLATTAEQPE